MRNDLPRSSNSCWLGRSLASVLVAGFALAFCGTAWADNLDEELIKQSKKIMADLRSHDYKNVAILKFTVARPNTYATYDAGLINANLANRLENALILASDVDHPIGITRNAGAIAAQAVIRKEIGLPSTADGRRSLFKLEYPLAWGTKKVSVAAFLTGVVKVSADMKETTLIVQAFDKKDPADLRTIAIVTVATDRSILSDLGQSFLVRRSINNSDDTQDKEAIDSAASLEKQKPVKVEADKTPVSDLVELKVYYDQQPIDFETNPNNLGAMRVTEPKEKQKIHFTLKNKSDKRLAVALRVNGQNTTVDDEDNLQPIEYTKWVLEPGKEYTVRGYYDKDGKTVKAFSVVADVVLQDSTLNPATRGLIQMDVFAEGPKPENPGLFSARNISLRANANSPAAKSDVTPTTLADARKQIMLATVNRKIQPSSKGVIAPGKMDATDVRAVTFENPVHAGSLIVRYYTKEKSSD